MDENKNPQAETLNEEQLEEVAGGSTDNPCYFEPENPPVHKVEDGLVRVKCKSTCVAPFTKTCRCHTRVHCINRWHIVEPANPGIKDGTWYAMPRNERNHDEARKIIKNLFV